MVFAANWPLIALRFGFGFGAAAAVVVVVVVRQITIILSSFYSDQPIAASTQVANKV
jgi:hypothetical protein